MYAVHSIPVSEIMSFKKHAPSIGWQYIVVVLNTGVSIPPLYFTTGGVKAFFSVLKQVGPPRPVLCCRPYNKVQHSLPQLPPPHCLGGSLAS